MTHITRVSCPGPALSELPASHTWNFIVTNIPDSLASIVKLIVVHVKAWDGDAAE